ncbi:MAG: hypothetical protein VCD33_07440 [Alphaproteobacteria bacterium]
MTTGGLTFSDAYGGFRIAAVSGTGTLADPFIVVEEITGPTSAVLIIEGLSPEFGNRVGTLHHTGFALRKIVHNSTPFIWSFMEFELQQEFGVSSDYLDGLSFGQGSTTGKPFSSDQFNEFLERDEPIDSIFFDGGYLRPGESAVFNIIITDTTPIPRFYLVQQPNRPTVQLLTNDATQIR